MEEFHASSVVLPFACKQPNAVAFMVNDQVETVVFDFVNPFRAGRDLGAARRDGGLELLASEICRGRRIATSARLSALVARHRRVAGLTKIIVVAIIRPVDGICGTANHVLYGSIPHMLNIEVCAHAAAGRRA